MLRHFPILALALLAGVLPSLQAAELSAKALEFFESKIRPVLAESCYECHNSVDKKKGDLALDWREPLVASGVIVPGKPEESDLIAAISHAKGFEPMPDKAPKLAKVTIQQFEDWIRMGAPDPRTTKPSKEDLAAQVDWPTVRDKRTEWWSFQPLKKSAAPRTDDPEWDAHFIDRFVATRMAGAGLAPQPEADPATLVRRLHLVLTGLPPRPETVREFVADPSPEAYVAMVDTLLASPRFGERWGRHWMDWYRYAETHGSEGDPPVPYAKVYRDYIVRALNADVPYDQLLREHLAGDLLPRPRINTELGLNESAIGPAQLRMVPHGFGVTNAYDEQITFTDNQVDVVSKAMLGLTVSCARCHNHKFDPISQKDFYRFYGIMVSSRPTVRNVDSPARRDLHRAEIAEVKQQFRNALAAHWLGGLDEAMQRLEGADLKELPDTDPFAAWAAARQSPKNVGKLMAPHAKAHRDRIAHNTKAREEATFYLDLRDPAAADRWFGNGNGLSGAVSPAGSFALAPNGDRALTGIYPAGIYSHLISDKHSATLNAVFHEAQGPHNAVRGIGNGATARFAMRSYALSHGLLHPSAKFGDQIGWKKIGKYDYWNGEQGYHHIATAADSTSRPGGERSWFGVMEICAGDTMPKETGAPLAAWHAELPGHRDALRQAYGDGLQRALQGWRDGTLDDHHALLLDAARRHGILPDKIAGLPEPLRTLVARYRALEAAIPVPTRVAGVMDGEVWNQPLLDRGDPRQEGKAVMRRFLEVFPGDDYPADASGRLELAEDILREDNPLAARVIVNRLWHHVFGTGLVPSPDNFGRLGKTPSHPALLDQLALAHRESGWSLKHSIRDMVLSRTFRSASVASAEGRDKDPNNRLLSHYPPRRLEAEAIHDSLQFVAAGKPGKRAVYQSVIRNRLDPFLTTFNFPVPTTTVGSRDLTNVPGQALTLLNGPLANQSAEQWARRTKANRSLPSDDAKIARMFEEAYARPPEPEELQACLDFLSEDLQNSDAPLLAKRDALRALLKDLCDQREALVAPVREKLTGTDRPAPPDLDPAVEWDFAEGIADRRTGLGGQLLGQARIDGGALILDGGCFLSDPLPRDFHEKTLEVVVELADLNQRGGGALTIQDLDGHLFDSIVFGEQNAGEWMAGSNHFQRTRPMEGERETSAAKAPVHLALVLGKNGRTQLFRNGEPYGKAYKNAGHLRYQARKCQIAIGLRHGKRPDGKRILRGRISTARLYDRALPPEEIAAASAATVESVTMATIRAAMTATQQQQLATFEARQATAQEELAGIQKKLGRATTRDAWTRLAHALINTKEFIYVR